MEKDISAFSGKATPLELLVRNSENQLFKSKEIVGNVIAICIQNRGWLLAKIPADRCSPAAFLQLVKDYTGLPVIYPCEEDYQKLFDEKQLLKITVENLRKNSVNVAEFLKGEPEMQKAYIQQCSVRNNNNIRLAIDLDKLF